MRIPLVVAALLLVLPGACTVGPSNRPDLAVYGENGDAPQQTPQATTVVPTGPGGPGQDGRFTGPWQTCPRYMVTDTTRGEFEFSCNELVVPVDHFQDREEHFDLRVARARASQLPENAPELVVLLADQRFGNGLDGATDLARTIDRLPTAITSKFSILGVDIRGTNGGLAATCLTGPAQRFVLAMDPDAMSARSVIEVGQQLGFLCGDATAPFTTLYNASAIADDLDSLRAALEQDTLSLIGSGYGANLAAVYVDRYPGRVGRAVLDGPADHLTLRSDSAISSAVAYEQVLESFIDSCGEMINPCPLGSDPSGAIDSLMSQLTDADPDLTSGTIKWLLTLGLPERDRWPVLANTLASAAEGDSAAVRRVLTDWLGPELSDWFLLTCNDSAQRLSESELETGMTTARDQAPIFGSFLVGLTALCATWPVPEYPLGAVKGSGAAPVLVLGGVEDPAAPYTEVRAVSVQLSSARLLSWQNSDHGSLTKSDCVAAAVTGYLIRGELPSQGLVCPP